MQTSRRSWLADAAQPAAELCTHDHRVASPTNCHHPCTVTTCQWPASSGTLQPTACCSAAIPCKQLLAHSCTVAGASPVHRPLLCYSGNSKRLLCFSASSG